MASQETADSKPPQPSPEIEDTDFPAQLLEEIPAQKAAMPPAQSPQPPPNPRLQSLLNKQSNLQSTLSALQAEKAALISTTPLPSGLAMPSTWSDDEKTKSAMSTANASIKEHIALLHKYNEIKDIAQGLMGMIAEGRGVRMKDVMDDFGVEEKD